MYTCVHVNYPSYSRQWLKRQKSGWFGSGWDQQRSWTGSRQKCGNIHWSFRDYKTNTNKDNNSMNDGTALRSSLWWYDSEIHVMFCFLHKPPKKGTVVQMNFCSDQSSWWSISATLHSHEDRPLLDKEFDSWEIPKHHVDDKKKECSTPDNEREAT